MRLAEYRAMSTWDERFIKRERLESLPELMTSCWRMRGPLGQVLSSAIYRTDAGLEVRTGFAELPMLGNANKTSFDA